MDGAQVPAMDVFLQTTDRASPRGVNALLHRKQWGQWGQWPQSDYRIAGGARLASGSFVRDGSNLPDTIDQQLVVSRAPYDGVRHFGCKVLAIPEQDAVVGEEPCYIV